jgi:hypothetical protein
MIANSFRQAMKSMSAPKPMATRKGFVYGNPTAYQVDAMSNPNELCSDIIKSGILNKYYNMPWQSFVEGGDRVAKAEIDYMIALQKELTDEDKKFILDCEEDIPKIWNNYLKEISLPSISKETIKEFIDGSDGVLFLLKYHFQRPRPLQLAYLYAVDLYPFLATNANSPAYPSGHAFDAYKVAFLLSKRYPEKSMQLMNMADRIAISRIKGGVHYPSDSIISKMLARELVDNGFLDKYLEHDKH